MAMTGRAQEQAAKVAAQRAETRKQALAPERYVKVMAARAAEHRATKETAHA